MDRKHLSLHAPSGVCTRALVLAILESRRAYQLAMSLAKRLLADDGYVLDDPEGEQPSGHHQAPAPSTYKRATADDHLASDGQTRRSAFDASPYKRRQRRKKRLAYGMKLVVVPSPESRDAYASPMTLSRLSEHSST